MEKEKRKKVKFLVSKSVTLLSTGSRRALRELFKAWEFFAFLFWHSWVHIWIRVLNTDKKTNEKF
jgi:hypothetical protein